MPIPEREDAIVVRSEEQLRVNTVRVAVQRAVVRRVIVTEERMVSVVVRREVLRIDYKTIDPALSPSMLGDEPPLEIVLREERAVVTTTVVPVERVRISVRSVLGEEVVLEQVRSEQVSLDQ